MKKQYLIIGGVFLVLVVITIFILVTTGVIYGLGSAGLCADTPYNSDCYCGEGDEKLTYNNPFGRDAYYCEPVQKYIDITQPGWENQAELDAKQKISTLFPNCNMINCDLGGAYLETRGGVSLGDTIANVISVSCYIDKTTNTRNHYWTVQLYSASGEDSSQTYACADYTPPPEVVQGEPAELTFGGQYNSWYSDRVKMHQLNYDFTFDCGSTSSEIAYATYTVPNDLMDKMQLWRFYTVRDVPTSSQDIDSVTCDITQQSSNSFDFSCSANCPDTTTQMIKNVYFQGDYAPANYAKCYDTDGNYVLEGQTIICNADSTKYQCSSSGTWLTIGTGWGTVNNRCPDFS